MLVVNNINQFGQHALGAVPASGTFSYLDVNGDAAVTPLDVLLVVNRINATAASSMPQPATPLVQATSAASPVAAMMAESTSQTAGDDDVNSPEVQRCAAHQAVDAALQSQSRHDWSADSHDLWSLLASDSLLGRKSARRIR